MSTLIAVIGFATLFNIIIILYKFRKFRIVDAILDLSIMCAILAIFKGTFSALAVGMIASAGVSIYLLFYPVYLIHPQSNLRAILNNMMNKLAFWR